MTVTPPITSIFFFGMSIIYIITQLLYYNEEKAFKRKLGDVWFMIFSFIVLLSIYEHYNK